MRPRKRPEEQQVKISGTVKRPVFDWLEAQISAGRFYNRSHAIQEALRRLKEDIEGEDPVIAKMRAEGVLKPRR